ncbi:LANO_0F12662g1_1 [Lachancea nothofagi CBS 11611]|uniref:LANO_0F12662g1_1 n=1 Tax=Lachancea nothofagi CBS 11611 TaxID=1266666 RepID=A0A1G4KBI1_9SACH|nr:LANO_0F12662g1_1 [Lachancea nothofagi CBS 11611]
MGQELTLSVPTRVTDVNLKIKGGEEVMMQTLTMNRERCLNRELVDSFFRTLRHNSDDVIQQKLNNAGKTDRRAKSARCQEFVKQELFPSWDLRLKAVGFCEKEAFALKQELDEKYGATSVSAGQIREARMDPYAAAERLEAKESHYAQWKDLNRWIGNQHGIERILQRNAANILARSCDPDTAYFTEFEEFRKSL